MGSDGVVGLTEVCFVAGFCKVEDEEVKEGALRERSLGRGLPTLLATSMGAGYGC